MATIKVKTPVTLPAGVYGAKLTAVEEREARDGSDFLRWAFAVDYEGGTFEISGASSTNGSRAAKPFKWATALLGYAPADGELDLDALVGRPCQLVLVIKTTDNGEVNNVDEVLPAPRGKSADPAPF